MQAVVTTNIPGGKKLFSGKVRDVYEVDAQHLIIVATDRVSAFDFVFPNGIPNKGVVLNSISNLWFNYFKFIKNHLVETDYRNFPKPYCDFPEQMKDRAVLVRRTERIDFECVARGFLIGSGWKDYQQTGSVCGIKLPSGLQMAQELPEAIFTPAAKADTGHDENVSIDSIVESMGKDVANQLKENTLKIYSAGRDKLKEAGILLADTKFEFGIVDNEIILIDEVLTPDSSRFWDGSLYKVGTSPVSYDKQFIRDYLDTTPWDKNSAPSPLPDEIVEKTRLKYEEIYQKIKAII